ncbi:MAG: ABC transporter ATP-binding protein [Pseudomonadales bacterium]|nr:ABC transporter ATP-binding protein [Pseudomonadales bacterium]
MALLEVENLHVEFNTFGGTVKAVRGVGFNVDEGETLAIVGESGCGKSVSVQSLMGLIPNPPGRITRGSVKYRGHEIIGNPSINGQEIRGTEIAMIFQDPMSSLNPTMTIGSQISETLQFHNGLSKKQSLIRAVELLTMMQIPDATRRAKQYPFEFSGGMLQRSMIAMALACDPSILIADEPTTALDVTIQSQILELLKNLQAHNNMAIVLITHDLGVVARMADQVAVMYAGEIIEQGSSDEIFYQSAHPYTVGLRSAMPTNTRKITGRLEPIQGAPPDLYSPPPGCGYFARCPHAMDACEKVKPEPFNMSNTHYSKCWLQHNDCPQVVKGIYKP